MQIRPTSSPPAKPTQIGTYDAGLTDLSDKVTIDNKKTFATHAEAVAYAQQNPGAEMVVEQRNSAGKLGFDVYQVTIHDKDQRLKSPTEMKNLSLFDKPLDIIAKASGSDVQRAFFVTEDGTPTANIYSPAFDRTVYDKMRSGLGLDDSKMWFKLVDKYMTAPSPADDIPPLSSAEINDMKSKLQTGDIIMTGNNGSFIHAIIYVGEDKALQAQLEKKWNMAPGTLNGEGMIIHSLAADHSAEIEINGKKQQQPAGGTGVIIDTIERYHGRNPRDTMMVVGVKGATEADRKAVVEAGKQMVGRGYDNGFNTFDDRDIYCTEFVYKAWLAAPDSRTDFNTQLHPLVPQTSGPVSGWLYDKVSPNAQKSIQDDGYLYQEMIMTDGIITSPAVELKWVNQNADKSEFFQKHERWADGMAGNISKGYKDLLEEHIPNQAQRSPALVEQIRTMAESTRQRMK
jgi:hypothetical protein